MHDITHVEDRGELYSRDYFLEYHHRQYGGIPFLIRAQSDLPERCLYWLRVLLKYRLPPSVVLELGCGHGGFVALLRWAGFDGVGLELSPWIADFARRTFGVPVLVGPIERQTIGTGSLDVVALFDVLEHLDDPVATMRRCLDLLRPDGILLVQTPRVPDGKSYEELRETGDRFLDHLRVREHLYMFTERGLRALFATLGAKHVVFEPAIFDYDMFPVISRLPLRQSGTEEVQHALDQAPGGRLIRALLDLGEQADALRGHARRAEADARARLENINRLAAQLAESEADRAARLETINRLAARLEESEADRAARLDTINRLAAQLAESEADRAARLETINRLAARLEESEADRAARLDTINRLAAQLAESEAQRDALRAALTEREERLSALESRLQRTENNVEYFRVGLEIAQEALGAVATSRAYRILRRLDRWKRVADVLDQCNRAAAGTDPPPTGDSLCAPPPRASGKARHVAVDLTPLLPGGENGGAKVVTLELLRQMARLAPDWTFTLLTNHLTHEELATLDAPNVRRLPVSGQSAAPPARTPLRHRVRLRLQEYLAAVLPPDWLQVVKAFYRRVSHRPPTTTLLRQLRADVLFCPFTAPLLYDPTVPTVSMVHDIQHRYYPQFFSPDERYYREKNLADTCRLANYLICVSEHTRTTVLEQCNVSHDRVHVVHTQLADRLPRPSAETATRVTSRFGLTPGRFIVYPANFWPHKNHLMLLTAFGIYRRRHPNIHLKLVCPGAPGPRQAYVKDAAHRLGLAAHIVLPGYVTDEELAALLQASLAVVFPSLYEGFGMPVLEAMACGTPVLCSNLTSLPEIAGDAALYFDPRNPFDIVAAIERIESAPDLRATLIAAGRLRVSEFSHPERMAQRYLELLAHVQPTGVPATTGLYGVYPDGWTSNHVSLTYAPAPDRRYLELALSAPAWLPVSQLSVQLIHKGASASEHHTLCPGQSLVLHRALPSTGGILELIVSPTFQPKAFGYNDDTRLLGCVVLKCLVLAPAGVVDLLHNGVG
jgi:glycosyltransferase involved in cell wall biosynthesis/SAM-dependent methyltransferase